MKSSMDFSHIRGVFVGPCCTIDTLPALCVADDSNVLSLNEIVFVGYFKLNDGRMFVFMMEIYFFRFFYKYFTKCWHMMIIVF